MTRYNTKRGYHFALAIAPPSATAGTFVQVTRQGKRWLCSSQDLMRLNSRAREAVEEIQLLSTRIVAELCAGVRRRLEPLYRLSDALALLDLLCSHAEHASTSRGGMCRPELTEDGPIAIKAGRHPLLEVTIIIAIIVVIIIVFMMVTMMLNYYYYYYYYY